MSTLSLFSSSRALQNFYSLHQGKLPECLLWGEFLGQCCFVSTKKALPLALRKIFLSHAALNVDVSALEFDRQFLDFLEQSHFIFPFLDELASALVKLEDIELKDTYGEYEDHLRVLTQLKDAYLTLLESKGFYDPILQKGEFIPSMLAPYEQVDFFVDGFLSPYEKSILEQMALHVKLHLHFDTDNYNVEHFAALCDHDFKPFKKYIFDFGACQIIDEQEEAYTSKVHGYAFDSSLGQVALCLHQIQKWVDCGINPSKIAIVLPSENFKESLKLFDTYRNFNYAMGESFTSQKPYQLIEQMMMELKGDNEQKTTWLIEATSFQGLNGLKKFIALLQEQKEDEAASLILDVCVLFESAAFILESYSLTELLHLVLLELKERRVDDVAGGKIRVMGVLETRGLELDAVIVVDMNDGLVPKANEKDLFLNSIIRKQLGLPTYKDRENLQKHYYLSLLRRSQNAAISWVNDDQSHVSSLVLESQFISEIDIELHHGEVIYGDTLFGDAREIKVKQDCIQAHLAPDFELSYSKLKKFLQCPLAFYYAYVQEIKEPLLPESLNMGIAVHACLEESYQKYEDPDLREAFFYELLSQVGVNEYDRFSLELVSLYMQNFFKEEKRRYQEGERVLFVEKDFKCNIFGFSFRGKIDRISKQDDQIKVVDYKLSRHIERNYLKSESAILQFAIYKKALENMGYSNIQAYTCHLYTGEWFECDLSKGDELLQENLEKLKNCQSFVPIKSLNCHYCAYGDLCGIAYV